MDAKQKIRNDIIHRVPLSKVIPLDTPFRLGIDVSNGCNFRCVFCFHSLDPRFLKKINFKSKLMEMETFNKLVRQMEDFPNKFKSITFGGIGEPLLHKELPKMIRTVKNLNKSEKISLVTNGSLLNKELNKELIDAGLDEIIISVEALSSEKYYEITNFKLNFENYVNKIEHLYKNKNKCNIYVKIVDISFNDENSDLKFHKIFDNISDLAYVETIVPRYKHVNYSKMKYTDNNLSIKQKVRADICSLPFFSLSIFPSGNVGPCCVDYCENIVLGNITEQSLYSIWVSDKLKRFRLSHLKKASNEPICKGCKFTQHNGRIEDIIDEDANQLSDRLIFDSDGG